MQYIFFPGSQNHFRQEQKINNGKLTKHMLFRYSFKHLVHLPLEFMKIALSHTHTHTL